MKRFLCFLIALTLILSVLTAIGEDQDFFGEAVPVEENASDEGDDSVVLPVDIPDDLEEETVDVRILQYGDDGDDVMELQTQLQELNYYKGNLSGRYREGTREAIRTFQEDFGLDQTGIADLQTQSLLFSTMYRPLRYGSSGDDVKELQTRLTELGYYKGKISGNYLEGSRAGIRTFQGKSGLAVTGIADPDTQEALYAPDAVSRSDVPDATPSPVTDAGLYLVDDTETSAENDRVAPDTYVEFTKKLKSGSSGKLVKQLQTRITELGYYTGPVSGNFAKNTVRAIKTIQTQNGLESTGVVDEETWNVIFNDAKVVLPDNTPKPTPEPTPVPFAITVDVANQVTTVYGRDESGNYSVVIRQMLCSTGLKATPSDVGDWVLGGRKANWCVFPKWGNSYARYWTKINGSIAFHSVIYTAVNNKCMDISSYKKLGKRASHGCIRLTVADAKWIYDNVGAGTVVSIVENLPADPELRDSLKLAPINKRTCTPEETPIPTASPDYRSMVKPDIEKKSLKKGSESEAVYWVQNRLKELGFYNGKCSGRFLDGTAKAVIAFQRAVGVSANGSVNQELIDRMAEEAAPTATPAPTSTPKPEKKKK